MALSKIQPASMDLTANYAFTGTNSIPSASSGTYEQKKLTTLTASSSSTLSFTSSIDSTYNIYKFRFVNIHPSASNPQFTFNASADSGSNYNVTKTTTWFNAYNDESGGTPSLNYFTGGDLAQSTDFQRLANAVGNENDHHTSGELFLFDPSSTTFVKHFICRIQTQQDDASAVAYSVDAFISGYFNTTSAIDAIQFKMSSGNIDSGTIEMYGIN